MDNQAGGIGHITQHVIRLQFERVRRAVGETPLEDQERIVQAHLTALAESGTPVEDQATANPRAHRGHCTDRAMTRFVQD